MKNTFLLLFVIFNLCLQSLHAEVIPFSSAESVQRLSRATYKVPFFSLANFYQPQKNAFFCGPTSAVIILNALRVPKSSELLPTDTSVLPSAVVKDHPQILYKRYTQETILIDAVKTDKEVYGMAKYRDLEKLDYGFQVRQLAELLNRHQVKAELIIADDTVSDESLKEEMIRSLGMPGSYLIVNFFRPVLGQKGGGHFSPVAAYDIQSDSFLILDTNPNTVPWSWVDSQTLLKSLRTFDTVENRGLILVSEMQERSH